MAPQRGCWLVPLLVLLSAGGVVAERLNTWTEELGHGGPAPVGGRRSLQSTTAAGLYAEVFYNYPFPSQPDPIPTSLQPDYVTSAPNINYAEGSNDKVGIQLLAKSNTSFAIRFSGTITPPNTATTTYAFGIRSDDASSLYINNVKIVNDSGIHSLNGPYTGTATLASGGHTFQANYFQNAGGAGFIVSYATGTAALATVPSSWFTYSPPPAPPPPPPRPPPSPPTAAGLYVEVFYNYKFPSQPDPISTSLTPSYVTSAPNINYASHASDNIGIQLLAHMNNTFAIRFSGTITPPITMTTTYTFGISSDDASSLYIDGVKIANDSGIHAMNGPYTGSMQLSPGSHSFQANYFQNTGSAGFIVTYAAGTAALAAVPASWFSYVPREAPPTASAPPPPPPPKKPPPPPPPPRPPPPPSPPPPRKPPPPPPPPSAKSPPHPPPPKASPPPKKPPPPPKSPPPPSPPNPPFPPNPPRPPPAPPPPPPSAVIAAVKSGKVQMNGVNLGGWLVIEEFLAPDMYANATTMKPYASPRIPNGVNLQDYGVYGERQLGWAANEQDANDTTHKQNYTGRLREAMFYHRDTFIQESDFALMAENGINCVRIPVGFWLFQETQIQPPDPRFPFVEGSYQNLNNAFDWAEKYGIGIWLDYHAHNGSQNGYEASAPTRARAKYWDVPPGLCPSSNSLCGLGNGGPNANEPSYFNDSIAFGTQLAQYYCNRTAMVALAPMNEPNTLNATYLGQFYYQFYPIFRQYCPDQWFIIAPQIFYEIPGTFWQPFMANSSYTKVLQDIHDYPKSPSPNTVDAWTAYAFVNLTNLWSSYVKGGGIAAVFGEWTLAGPNYPYDYNRLGSWENSYQQINTSNYYDAQKHAFLQTGTQGWFQWNYRIFGDDGPDVWSFYRCIYNDWLGKAHLFSYPTNVSCVGC